MLAKGVPSSSEGIRPRTVRSPPQGFTIGLRNMTGVKFRKFDKFYNEVYEEDYKQELKGKDLNRIVPFDNKLFIFLPMTTIKSKNNS